MKRSEMMKIMLDSYCEEVPYHDDGGIQLMLRLDRLLNVMEKSGMLPPPQRPIQFDTVEDEILCRWENEDETY